ncbi:YuzD family protein [Halobacillus sp. A1]|uniref:YuzD family protein n=1 Tax=Halobacillus sp. A1 TaxID=2880262 RepID=UPI0020A6470A|nr:DUF1462 family protein [Halobacillus sp. A1]MCP3032786.1 YuzD family protein [Halobacillus sp. A1]
MTAEKITLTVYGAEERCASCVNAPGSKETYEWLQAAIARKFQTDVLKYRYVDLHDTELEEVDRKYIDWIMEDELFYPLVVVNEKIAGEGNPRLKEVYAALEEYGLEYRKDI